MESTGEAHQRHFSVASATIPNQDLDGKIKLTVAASLFVLGVSKDEVVKILGGDLHADPLPYTASYDAATTLIPNGYTFGLGDLGEDDQCWACVTSADGVDSSCLLATSPILALCAAALRAMAAISNGERSDG